MGQVIEFSIPDSGEPMDSARLLKWLVEPGKELIRGAPLLEIETDKSVIEVVAPDDGRLIEQLVSENTRFDPSQPVARLELKSSDESEPPSASPPPPSAEIHEAMFFIPPSGEDIESARLVQWRVKCGNEFMADDVLLEIETDKSVIEVPAPFSGIMLEQFLPAGSTFDPSTPVALLGSKSREAASRSQHPVPSSQAAATQSPVPTPHALRIGTHDTRIFASPVARREMAAQAIGPEAVHGTGPHGRITLADVRAYASHATAENISTFVQTTTGRIHIRFKAASTPRQGAAAVVLVHGLFGDADTWSSLVSTLNREGLDVLSLDLPAHGQSEAGADSFIRIVDTLSETLMTLDGRPLALVGHSFGGAVVSRLANLSTIDVRSVVLIAPLGLCTCIEQDFLAGMTHSRSQESLQRELAKLTADGAVPSATYVSRLSVRLAERRTLLQKICESISWNGVQQVDVRADLEKLRCPASLLQGRQDQIIPWKGALNAPPRVGLHLLPGVGHMPHWEAPALTSEVILRAAI